MRPTCIYTVSQKRPNFETVWLEMIWIDFDDIWQKYSEGSRIEFAYFSFHVRLLVITLSSLKLHNENNVCMHAVRFNQLLSAPFLVALES